MADACGQPKSMNSNCRPIRWMSPCGGEARVALDSTYLPESAGKTPEELELGPNYQEIRGHRSPAAEWHAGDDPFDATGRPNLGEANVYVTNIGAHDPEGGPIGGVEFYLHVDWDSPLHVQVTITVLDPIDFFEVAN